VSLGLHCLHLAAEALSCRRRYSFNCMMCHTSDAARKMTRIEIIDQKVPGQKDMFAPVLSGVPGQMTRCPCGFGAYALCSSSFVDDVRFYIMGSWDQSSNGPESSSRKLCVEEFARCRYQLDKTL